MTILLIKGQAFLDLDNYCILICSEEEFRKATIDELQEMANNAILAKQLSSQMQFDFEGCEGGET